MDILALASGTGLLLIAARVLLLFSIVSVLLPYLKFGFDVYFKDEYDAKLKTNKHYLRLFLFSIASVAMIWTFQASPYIPKHRVVEETNTEFQKAEAERMSEKLTVGVKPSEADAKAAARKSDIDIRQEFEKHPDRK